MPARANRPFRLIDRSSASYSRALFVTATGAGREHNVRFDPETGESFIRSTKADEAASPIATGTKLPLDDAPRDQLRKGLPALLARVGIDASAVALRNPPDLICTVEQDGRRWRLAYNLQTEAISTRL